MSEDDIEDFLREIIDEESPLDEVDFYLILIFSLAIHIRKCSECSNNFRATCQLAKRLNSRFEKFELIFDESRRIEELLSTTPR